MVRSLESSGNIAWVITSSSAKIEDHRLLVLVLRVGHRKEIYR
jgi:hypothetical protein